MTWKIVGAAEASVLYIYIQIRFYFYIFIIFYEILRNQLTCALFGPFGGLELVFNILGGVRGYSYNVYLAKQLHTEMDKNIEILTIKTQKICRQWKMVSIPC